METSELCAILFHFILACFMIVAALAYGLNKLFSDDAPRKASDAPRRASDAYRKASYPRSTPREGGDRNTFFRPLPSIPSWARRSSSLSLRSQLHRYSFNNSEGGRGVEGESLMVSQSSAVGSLQSILTDFTQKKLGVSGEEVEEVLQLSWKVATILKDGLQERSSQFNYPKDPEPVGSASDATMIPSQGDCDYLLHVEIPESVSVSLHDQGEGFWKIEPINPSEPMKKLCVQYVFRSIDYYCLNPLEFHCHLIGKVQQIIDNDSRLMQIPDIVEISHVSGNTGPAIKLKVTYRVHDHCQRSFDMDFVPCFTINGKQLVSKRHPSVGKPHELTKANRKDPENLRWRQSFSPAERDRISPLAPDDGWQCTKKVFLLVKYLRYNQSQFRKFSTFVYKTVFLYLLDDYDDPCYWHEEDLEDRFMDYMEKLEEFFKTGKLYHYFLWKREGIYRNLLDGDEKQVEQFYNFLNKKNKNPISAWGRLVKTLDDSL